MEKLYSLSEVSELIVAGEILLISGDRELLRQLPDGQWIGGSIPYLMGENGGELTTEKLYVKKMTDIALQVRRKFYDETNISQITNDSYENGVTFLILPAFEAVHAYFAVNALKFDRLFEIPLIGWVSGNKGDELPPRRSSVHLGNSMAESLAVAMHIQLPPDKQGRLGVVNLYRQGDGDEIQFKETVFGESKMCLINGNERNFYDYLLEKNFDFSLPLVGNYKGMAINVGIVPNFDNHTVRFLAPAFAEITYKIAQSDSIDYPSRFKEKLIETNDKEIRYSCNCLMNYYNFDLEGKKIADFTGTFTFGEIAYILLNQCFVYLVIDKK